jgi:pimeloyl-ACP methyl ester carboxylesterase
VDRPLILYLHGFTSGPQSQKVQLLAARMAQRGCADRLLCPQLPAAPTDAIALADKLIAKVSLRETALKQRKVSGTTLTVAGSSLGGFYATHLAEKYGLRAVLINPAVVAAIGIERKALQCLGLPVRDALQAHAHPGRGAAVHRVEHMGAEVAHRQGLRCEGAAAGAG